MMFPDGRRPHFIIIGAVKGATTWIAHQLRCHPNLWLPKTEPHYFSSDYARGTDWYATLFDEAPPDRILGEKSADYLAHPDAADRLFQTLPGARLIVQLRDPVQRAYSDYCMLYRRGMVGGDPRKYLQGQRSAERRFLASGLYARHLDRFLKQFPREQLHVLLYEDLAHSAEQMIVDICRHIGVPAHIAPDQLDSRKNDSSTPLLPLTLRRLLRPMRPALDPLRSNPVLARVRASLASPVRYPPLVGELHRMLRAYYRDDVLRLQDMLQRDLGTWLGGGISTPAGDTRARA
ncbi:sulfotransferase family protein [Sphingobium yanoikuyae]|nr:sulfotransferase [Sphingobium yanoikuyae]